MTSAPLSPASSSSSAGRDADIAHLRRTMMEIKKAVKSVFFNRHRAEQSDSFIAGAHKLLSTYLDTHGSLELKLEVSTVVWGDTSIFEDDGAENNLIYPLWVAGVRLLTLKKGITAKDLLRFFMTVVEHKKTERSDDLATWLWKQDFPCVEWIVVTDFDFDDEEGDSRRVEMEVGKVLNFLQDQLKSDSNDTIGFARVAVSDLDLKLEQLAAIRQTVVGRNVTDSDLRSKIQQEVYSDEGGLLRRISHILGEVMKLPASSRELGDIQQALEQLVDGLILEGQFATIDKLLTQLDNIARDANLAVGNRQMAGTARERLLQLMLDAHRVRAIATGLNSGQAKDLEGLGRYLRHLGPGVTVMLLDVLDVLQAPLHRKFIADIVAQVGQAGVPMMAKRLATASSNLAKDLLYVIDKINPPDKLQLLAPVLQHENGVLRMEGLTTIGRTKTDPCFRIIKDVAENHAVPQMRAHAARILADFPAPWSEPVLLEAVRSEGFETRADPEKRAFIGALAKLDSPTAAKWLRNVFQEKGSLFNKKVDERKLLVISAIQTAPGMPSLQLLSDIARDDKHNSRDVRDAAQTAASDMQRRMTGVDAAGDTKDQDAAGANSAEKEPT